jgi:hypothetical protein
MRLLHSSIVELSIVQLQHNPKYGAQDKETEAF